MALFTDTLFPNPADILLVEPDLPNELSDNNTATTLIQLCAEANAHCSAILASKLQSVIGATNFNPSGGATSLHNSAIIWGVRAQSNVVRLRMGQVVVDDLYSGDSFPAYSIAGPLRNWIAYWGVVLGYRRLASRADPKEDRMRTKYDFYRRLVANEKWALLRSTGLPYIRVPLPAPGAIFEPGSGVWSTDSVTAVSASGTTGGNFNVAITWVSQTSPTFYVSPAKKNNAESGPSKLYPTAPNPSGLLAVTATTNQALQFTIAGLTPPSGNVPSAEASITGVSQGTMIATGWNVYAGDADDDSGALYLQNAVPVPLSQSVYTLPADPVLTGFKMGRGQYPDANMPMGDQIMRS